MVQIKQKFIELIFQMLMMLLMWVKMATQKVVNLFLSLLKTCILTHEVKQVLEEKESMWLKEMK